MKKTIKNTFWTMTILFALYGIFIADWFYNHIPTIIATVVTALFCAVTIGEVYGKHRR